jgi:hypothetical protein
MSTISLSMQPVNSELAVDRLSIVSSRLPLAKEFSAAVGRALRRAAKVARKTARMHGTPIYIWKDGKVVAEKP